VAKYGITDLRTYSCGYSFGFTPNSLFSFKAKNSNVANVLIFYNIDIGNRG
jgi:hypothetical protein